MKFGILVNEGPYTHEASDTAYLFTKAALEKGHQIYRVFFYHDGVNNATQVHRAAAGRPAHRQPLVEARRAVQGRPGGVRGGGAAARHQGRALAPGFRISGLGQLVETGIQADRLVVFGD